jgi:hypothetical protein
VLKVGDRVVLTEESRQSCHVFHEHPRDAATVIGVSHVTNGSGYECVLEFDKNIGGHDGLSYASGKDGHCVIYYFYPPQWDKYFKKIQRNRKNNYY